VDPRVAGMSRLAAAGAIVIIASGVAGCATSGGAGGKSTATSTATASAQTPEQAIQLAASTARGVNSFTANMSIQASGRASAGAFSLTGTVSEQLHPSVLAEADYSTFSAAGQSIPGGMSEIVTTKSVYMKLSMLSQALHTSKPWLEIPFSSLSKASGVNISSLFSQLQTSSPLDQSQLFAGAQNVRTAGTGVVDGVPVTEYTGTLVMSKALTKLPAALRASIGQALEKAGISSARFTEWVDGQHQVRKTSVTETGSTITETVTTTITSINQPVNIQVPAASQTATLPATILNSM
jgi:hypothetical protein